MSVIFTVTPSNKMNLLWFDEMTNDHLCNLTSLFLNNSSKKIKNTKKHGKTVLKKAGNIERGRGKADERLYHD